ncbi:MAG TPA: glycosyltransferase family 39 protein [Chthoniobacterales bacterium]|nr:glycosyltransferase family 39 protein [Chthoniobacterales bacterium]
MSGMYHRPVLIAIMAVGVRLVLIDQPFVDHWSWRQSDVAAIARNYFQGGFHFARPQIDWAGDQPGYVGTEFPILPFIAALLYKLFAIHQWIGRIQGVILFAISLPFFFWLVRKRFGEIAALWALFFYSFAPLGIMASRCFMPDMPSLALSIIGLYLFERWIEDENCKTAFIASALCISLSILIKATTAIIGVPLAFLAFQRFRGSVFQRYSLWAFAGIALLPSALWYWHAYEISQQFYPHHFFGAGGIKIMSIAWYWKIARQIPMSTLTPAVFLLGCAGAVVSFSSSRAAPFQWWLVAMVLFIVIVGYGNRHPWYALPFVPIFAVFAGIACDFVAKRISNRAVARAFTIACVVTVIAPAALYCRKLYEPTAGPMREAGLVLQQIAPLGATLVAADNGDPTIFYYAERKGWHFTEHGGIFYGEPRDSRQGVMDLERLRKSGATLLVFSSDTEWWLDYYRELGQYVSDNAELVRSTSRFKIYKFKPVSG